MNAENEQPKIHIDSDWKAEAQEEKERLAQEEGAAAERPPLGKPTFLHLVNMLAMQASVALGGMRGPQGETIAPDPELARFHIDTLSVLEEKTVGNLTDEEKKALANVLHELRSLFVQAAQAAPQPPKS